MYPTKKELCWIYKEQIYAEPSHYHVLLSSPWVTTELIQRFWEKKNILFFQRNASQIGYLESRRPIWSELKGNYLLSFRKNSQCSNKNNILNYPGEEVNRLEFSRKKDSKENFVLVCQRPFSLIESFAYALIQFWH